MLPPYRRVQDQVLETQMVPTSDMQPEMCTKLHVRLLHRKKFVIRMKIGQFFTNTLRLCSQWTSSKDHHSHCQSSVTRHMPIVSEDRKGRGVGETGASSTRQFCINPVRSLSNVKKASLVLFDNNCGFPLLNSLVLY